MAINKVEFGNQTLIDLTSDTVSSDKLLSGETAHDRSGNSIVGSVVVQNYTEGDGIDISANNEISVDTTFTEASTRTNINSGDTLATIWGKIKKFFSDLKTVAFSGSYNDLTDKPNLATVATSGSYNDLSNKPTIINVTRGASVSTATTNYWASMCNSTQAGSPTLPTAGKWWHVLSMDWTGADTKNWFSQLAIATQDGDGVWWRKNNASGTEIDSSTWHRLAEGDANGNAIYATSAGTATDSTKVAKAGDTMTGVLITEKGSYSRLCNGGSGTNGYFHFLRIVVTSTYVNTPIVLSILDRGKWETVCSICFSNSGSTDPTCNVVYRGSRPIYFIKSATSTWDFYVQKGEAYGTALINILNAGQIARGGITFTWQNSTVASLPSGYSTASVEGQNLKVTHADDSDTLGGASASESATASTIVKRNVSGYIYAVYYNASNGAENINSYSTAQVVFKDSNGWQRCTSKANFQTWLGVESSATPSAGKLVSWLTGTGFLAGHTVSGTLNIYTQNATSASLSVSSNSTLNIQSGSWLNLRCTQQVQCRNANDTAWVNIAAANISSSRRYKENIQDLTEEEARKLLDIRTVTFDFKEQYAPSDDWEHERFHQQGVIAEEVVDIYPTLVRYSNYENPDEEPIPTFVEYSHFVPYLIKMVQMQQKEIDELKAQVKELQSQ